MFKFYLYVGESIKGFNDYELLMKEKAFFERLGYTCVIKYR